jgi:hypothetical protein
LASPDNKARGVRSRSRDSGCFALWIAGLWLTAVVSRGSALVVLSEDEFFLTLRVREMIYQTAEAMIGVCPATHHQDR